MFADNAIAEAETEAGAFAGGLGGEERIENFVEMIPWNAGAVVLDRDADVSGIGFGGDANDAVTFDVFECLAGIVEDVEDDLLELVTVTENFREVRIKLALHLDVTGAHFVSEN